MFALVRSNTPGGWERGGRGDGHSIMLASKAGAFKDIVGNEVKQDAIADVSESDDVIHPLLNSVHVHYGYGLVTFYFSETIDVTPEGLINKSLIYFQMFQMM